MDALREIHPEINQYINLDCLVPYLHRHRILTRTDDFHLQNSSKASDEKVAYLLQVLDRKGVDIVKKFIRALKEEPEHTGHKTLCALLVQRGIDI